MPRPASEPATNVPELARRPIIVRSAPARAGLHVLVLVLALITNSAAAQPPGTASTHATSTDPPVIAVHYQDMLSGDPTTIDLFIPPPLIDWSEFSYAAGSCLKGSSVLSGPPDKALIVRFEVEGEGPCATKVDLLFGDGTSTWSAAAIVVVNRLPPLPPVTSLQPSFTSAQIRMPYARSHDPNASLMLLGLTNTGTEPLRVLGFGNDEAFASLIGQAFSYEPSSFHYRYEDLVTNGAPFEPTVVEAGDTANFALILDAHGQLPDGAATLTMQAVALIELDGQLYTLSFPRLSTAWGVELP